LMLEKQGIGTLPRTVAKEEIYSVVDRLGCVQIDSINVVERAHHVTLWTRLGCFDKELLHSLMYLDRRLFEYWAHAASVIPMKDYKWFTFLMKYCESIMETHADRYLKGDSAMLDAVLERIRKEGALASKDFKYKRERESTGWWDWKPAKIALETLFNAGILLVSDRRNFQRVYDLAERVIPDWVEQKPPNEEECLRFFATKTVSCLGLMTPAELRGPQGYYKSPMRRMKMNLSQIQELLKKLVEEGIVSWVEVEGVKTPYYGLMEDVDRAKVLEEGGKFDFIGVRFFNLFDNLLWDRNRVKTLFDFSAELETYAPREARRYGYYTLPILYGDQFIGRLDPKMDRRKDLLIIKAILHEPWFKPDEEFEDRFSETLESFAKFNEADGIEIEDKPRTA